MKQRELYEKMEQMNQEEFDKALESLKEEEKKLNESDVDEQSKRVMRNFRRQCEKLYNRKFNKKEYTDEEIWEMWGGKY